MIILKSEEQINGIRKSSKILAESFVYLADKIKPGITTAELDKIVFSYFKGRGAKPAFLNYQGFPASICASVNDTVIHGIPNNRQLKDGDIIGCDIGVIYEGYISDMAYTFPVGTVTSAARQLMEVTEKSLYTGIEAVCTGNRIKDIGKAITEYIRPFGYGIVHQFCGHGVGLQVHEEPQISNNYPSFGRNTRIKEGMVLAIEPMINIGSGDVKILDDGWTVKTVDGTLSAHYEHTVAVFGDRTEILTKL